MSERKNNFRLGKSIDEINIGDEAEGSMLVTEETIELYGKVSGDRNPIHYDKEYAATTIFGKPIAHGPIAGALVARVIGMDLPGLGTLAYSMKINFLSPVYAGDTLTAKVIATEKVLEKNLLRMSVSVINQENVEVISGYANVMPPIKDR